MDIANILELKFPGINLVTQVVLRDDGQGQYIYKWDESLGPKPDQVILDQWALEVAPIKARQDVRQKRREEYDAMGDQLDAIMKQINLMKSNGIAIDPDMEYRLGRYLDVKARNPLE